MSGPPPFGVAFGQSVAASVEQCPGLADGVVHRVGAGDAAPEQGVGFDVGPLVRGEPGSAVHGLDPVRAVIWDEIEQLGQPLPALREVPPRRPERGEPVGELQPRWPDSPSGTSRARPGSCRARARAGRGPPCRASTGDAPDPWPDDGTARHAPRGPRPPRAGASAARRRTHGRSPASSSAAPSPKSSPDASGCGPPVLGARRGSVSLGPVRSRRRPRCRADRFHPGTPSSPPAGAEHPALNRSWLHAIVARSVRCRSGTSLAPATNRPSESSSRASSVASGSRLTRAAASSIGNGRPSSRSTIPAIASAFWSSMAKPGTRAAARAANSWADSHAATEPAERAGPRSGTRIGGTGYSCSPDRWSGDRLVTRIRS